MSAPKPQPFPAAVAFRQALLAWFARHRRPLPWRTEVSAYRTVVSELMCQQTQVATVIPYFERWVARWPSFAALARAREPEVLAAWAGLGYYTRARNLLALAQQVAGRPEPRTAEDWRAFKGVGPYTAAAIASIAFGEPVAVVDGNVIRVLARVTGLRARLKDGAAAARRLAPSADALVDPRHPGDFNQAMMELGATVCRKAAPACDRCPVARWCDARRRGDAAELPRLQPKARRTDEVSRGLVRQRGRILLHRIPAASRRLAGMAELPTLAVLGVAAVGEPTLVRRRTIGSVTYLEHLHALPVGVANARRWAREPALEWVGEEELADVALTGPHLRWLREWLSPGGRPARGRRP
jgi:A/G-specific adenine glycosylase